MPRLQRGDAEHPVRSVVFTGESVSSVEPSGRFAPPDAARRVVPDTRHGVDWWERPVSVPIRTDCREKRSTEPALRPSRSPSSSSPVSRTTPTVRSRTADEGNGERLLRRRRPRWGDEWFRPAENGRGDRRPVVVGASSRQSADSWPRLAFAGRSSSRREGPLRRRRRRTIRRVTSATTRAAPPPSATTG